MHTLRTDRLLNISDCLTGIEGVCVNCKQTTSYKELGSAICTSGSSELGEGKSNWNDDDPVGTSVENRIGQPMTHISPTISPPVAASRCINKRGSIDLCISCDLTRGTLLGYCARLVAIYKPPRVLFRFVLFRNLLRSHIKKLNY